MNKEIVLLCRRPCWSGVLSRVYREISHCPYQPPNVSQSAAQRVPDTVADTNCRKYDIIFVRTTAIPPPADGLKTTVSMLVTQVRGAVSVPSIVTHWLAHGVMAFDLYRTDSWRSLKETMDNSRIYDIQWVLRIHYLFPPRSNVYDKGPWRTD